MSKNQFSFTRKQVLAPKEGEQPPQFKEFTDSFNINKVIRSMELEDGRVLVILDDTHERIQEVPILNKQNVKVDTKKEKYTFQSEIFLEVKDVARFRAASDLVVIL
jgi:hypothetical protein